MLKQKNVSFKKGEMIKIAEILKAVAHPDRLAILNLLCKSSDKRLGVKMIYEELNMQQPIVSRHLNILKNAGVVKRLQEGQKCFYSLCFENQAVKSLSGCFC
ncbi:MAG: metalloregulator ArsR/SmtB family transcription factor [Chitinophagaceae bacterium]|nr:metalloregulator ArsR/SmtB family transcription factor [Chitinophagaceae bacterium]